MSEAEQYPLHPETTALVEIMKQGKPFDPETATVSQFRHDAVKGNEAMNSSYQTTFTGSQFNLYIPSPDRPGL